MRTQLKVRCLQSIMHKISDRDLCYNNIIPRSNFELRSYLTTSRYFYTNSAGPLFLPWSRLSTTCTGCARCWWLLNWHRPLPEWRERLHISRWQRRSTMTWRRRHWSASLSHHHARRYTHHHTRWTHCTRTKWIRHLSIGRMSRRWRWNGPTAAHHPRRNWTGIHHVRWRRHSLTHWWPVGRVWI